MKKRKTSTTYVIVVVKKLKGSIVCKAFKVIVRWGITKEESKAFFVKHNAATCNNTIHKHDSIKTIPKVASTEGIMVEHMIVIKLFNVEFDKKSKVEEILTKINRSKYDDVLQIIFCPNDIVKFRCTKPKSEKILTVHLTIIDSKGEYPEKIHVSNLVKYGYN